MSRNVTEDRLTKIVCTIGRQHGESLPAMLSHFYDQGMDVARLNMSHCAPDYAPQIEALEWIREQGLPTQGPRIATLGDLQGPKVRLGKVASENEVLPTGEELVIRAAAESTDSAVLPIAPVLAEATFRGVAESIRLTGSPVQLTLGDGDAVLEITEVKNSEEAVARVRTGGAVRSRMGFTAKAGTRRRCIHGKQKDLRSAPSRGHHVGVFRAECGGYSAYPSLHFDVLGIDRYIPIISKSSGLSL